jgi:hypothetical protein
VLPDGSSAESRAGAESGRIARFREATRGARILVAREIERTQEVPVTWGATCGGTTLNFTPGGSGRRQREGSAGSEPQQTVI